MFQPRRRAKRPQPLARKISNWSRGKSRRTKSPASRKLFPERFSKSPDVSGPGETAGLAVAEPEHRPRPVVSEQIVDEEPVEVEPEVEVEAIGEEAAREDVEEIEPVEVESAKRQADVEAPDEIAVEEP